MDRRSFLRGLFAVPLVAARAVMEAGGGTVYLPAGVYNVSKWPWNAGRDGPPVVFQGEAWTPE